MEPDELAHLYRCASLLDRGIPVAGSSDTPYTDPDPWRAMRAAQDRTTTAGACLGADERISHRAALQLYLGDPLDPGGTSRRVSPGAAEGLCLLHRPLESSEPLAAEHVRAPFRAGRRLHG